MADPQALQNLVQDVYERLRRQRVSVAVVGDMILDNAIEGVPGCQHPETKVPILREATAQESIGGAANIALALARLGVQVSIYGIVGPDLYGLTKSVGNVGNWNQLTGSILGYGNGSLATFSGTTLWIAIDTWNCQYNADDDCVGYDPGPWTWSATKYFVALNGNTEERNNLSPDDTYTSSTPESDLPALNCPGWNGCYIEYTETSH